MKLYICGISGTAMGALALLAKDAGHEVSGSDLKEGAVTNELKDAKIEFKIGKQDGEFLQKKFDEGKAEWFVYSSALPKDNPELILAQKLGLKISKRDELISKIQKDLRLKMIAVAGTHGKTTTTSMIIYALSKLKIPTSHLVGSTLTFDKAGKYEKFSRFLIYEADEYDRNFLHFCPFLSVITTIDYDHPDIYPTKADYDAAFVKFMRQSKKVIYKKPIDKRITISGKVRKIDASLALSAVLEIEKTLKIEQNEEEIIKILNKFPGAGRRFEKLADGLYSDYAHHPEEIKSTIEMAKEEAEKLNKKGLVVIYEPHQNVRQHEVFDGYKSSFLGADKIFWLPTFLTREKPELSILQPRDFILSLENAEVAEAADLNEKLKKNIKKYLKENYLVLLMTAGPADEWLRDLAQNLKVA